MAHVASTPNPGPQADRTRAFQSARDFSRPAVDVDVQSTAASHGDIFLAPYSGPSQDGPMILDETGH